MFFSRLRWVVLAICVISIGAVRVSAQMWNFELSGRMDPIAGWTHDAGDFNGDGRSDLVAYHPTSGSVVVGMNSTGSFEFETWGQVSPATGWEITAGDFNGNGRSDLALYHPSDGTVTIGVNQGSSFAFSSWGHMSPAAGWGLQAGDFDADGLADVALYREADGRVVVGRNLLGSFSFNDWTTLSPAAGWELDPGHFNGDTRSDLVAYHPSDGSVWVLESTGTSFTFGSSWAIASPSAGWQFHAADVCPASSLHRCFFEADGVDDIVGYHPSDGSTWVGRNTGNSAFSFTASSAPPTAPFDGWSLVGGRFQGSAIGGVAFYHPIDGRIYVTTGGFDGYAWPQSVAPGELVNFMVSGAVLPMVEFLRHTSIADGVGPLADAPVSSVTMGSLPFVPEVQPIPFDAFRDGAGWDSSFNLVIPANWPSGFYSARLTGEHGGHDRHHVHRETRSSESITHRPARKREHVERVQLVRGGRVDTVRACPIHLYSAF